MKKWRKAQFKPDKSQAVRLPAETRFPRSVKRVAVRTLGKARILDPLNTSWDSFFHPEEEGVTDDFMTERASQGQADRESLE